MNRKKKLMPKIVELNQQGQTNAEIAKTLGIVRSTVYNNLNRAGLERNKYSVNPKYLSDIVELNQQGQTNAEIAKTLGIAWSTVYNNLNRAGLERNRR